MGRYLKEARHCQDQINHFYDHAGSLAYRQSNLYYDKLGDLMGKAHNSSRDKSDAFMIGEIKKALEPRMDEMRRWESENAQAQNSHGEAGSNP